MDPYIPFLWSGTLVSSQLVLYEILYSGINSCHTNFSFRNSLFWYGIRPSLWKLRVNIPTFLLSYTLVSAVKLIFTYIYPYLQLPDGSAGKESACNAGDLCLIPGLERTPGEGNSMQKFACNILAWKFFLAWKLPWRVDPGGLQSKGLQRVGHDWATKHEERFLPPNQFIVCVLSARLCTGYFTYITF